MFDRLSFFEISTYVVPVVLAITMHEAAHGYVALWRGDDTAKRMGRTTLNPFRHIDPFGTIILPAMLILAGAPFFGFAKPVPVDYSRLYRRSDIALVAAAGPAANLVLAFAAALLLHVVTDVPTGMRPWVAQTLQLGLTLNLVFAIFNILPIPPLDGSKVAVGLLPRRAAYALARADRYGVIFLIVLVVALPWVFRELGVRFDPFWTVIRPALELLLDVVLKVSGHT
jgi:Zn-dependent protease